MKQRVAAAALVLSLSGAAVAAFFDASQPLATTGQSDSFAVSAG